MPRSIFVNLPVSDLGKSRRFMEALGATNEPKFTDDTAACMQLSNAIFVMLLTHDKFGQFTPRPIADATAASEVLLALSVDDRESVDHLVERAVQAGGKADPSPLQDHGVMYGRSVADPDGHIWEIVWMDPQAAGQAETTVETA